MKTKSTIQKTSFTVDIVLDEVYLPFSALESEQNFSYIYKLVNYEFGNIFYWKLTLLNQWEKTKNYWICNLVITD